MLSNVSSSIFTQAESVSMVPVVSAEWNQNLFNAPYVTVAGTGTKMTLSSPTGTVASVTDGAKPNFTTKSFSMANGTGKVSYVVTTNGGKAYKAVTYVKTNNPDPVMISIYGSIANGQGGSSSVEASAIGWTKVTTYIGASESDSISSFVYTINANDISGSDTNAVVFFTVPEVYETTFYDYLNHSFWPTESVFTNFRPGESYVYSGNANCTLPSNYRQITTKIIKNYSGTVYSPMSSIIQNPQFCLIPTPIPTLKSVLPTSLSQYKYFVSAPAATGYNPSITAIYEKPIMVNKLVIKMNALMTDATVNVLIDGTAVSIGQQTGLAVTKGLLTLYWTNGSWSTTKWSSSNMPAFDSAGALAQKTTVSKITLTQVSKTNNSSLGTYTSTYVTEDLKRMHLIEISPRLEINLSDFVEDLSIDKSLDSKNSDLPISATNANTAQITLSGIPAVSSNTPVPIFASQSDSSLSILSNMLRKGVKIYIGFSLDGYSILGGTSSYGSSTYIPGGVFYSDSWDENGIETVNIQCFDSSKMLQSIPASDYVADLQSVFDIITNLFDLSGFTDYDYDSLYKVCNNKTAPMDIFYYFNNSKDTTLIDAVNKILLPYQIAAYVDEYGVMKFKSLNDILYAPSSDISISDSDIVSNGFSISNKQKPGKISIKYQPPKVKQSPTLQNMYNKSILDSTSIVYTSSGDILWQQQSVDTIGFNYLDGTMSKDSNRFKINVNDLQDIFHTFNRDSQGYVVIENEVMSFLYKEYLFSQGDVSSVLGKFASLAALQTAHPTGSEGQGYMVGNDLYSWSTDAEDWVESTSSLVSVKNDTEYQSALNSYVKTNQISLRQSTATITGATGDGDNVTYTAINGFKAGDNVNISGVVPSAYNTSSSKILSATSTSFVVDSSVVATYTSGGSATIDSKYDVETTQTGYITNVQRGLFGTTPEEHKRITDLASKGLIAKKFDQDAGLSNGSSNVSVVDDHDSNSLLPSISKLKISIDKTTTNSVLIYPENHVDPGYQTYSVKFDILGQNGTAMSLFFGATEAGNLNDGYLFMLRKNSNDHYELMFYGPDDIIYSADVTGIMRNINNNFIKIVKPKIVNKVEVPETVSEKPITLKVIYYVTDGSDGENATKEETKTVFSAFLNNIEVNTWQEPGEYTDSETEQPNEGFVNTGINPITGVGRRPTASNFSTAGKIFGFAAQQDDSSTTNNVAALREIYATKLPLKERSVSYFFQDREFLNGLIEDRPLNSLSPSYMMQTTPEISGINIYDVQYKTPAAITADIWPIQYMQSYWPQNYKGKDRSFLSKKLVDEYSLAYSSVLNTGFRAKFAIANNASHLVFLRKESDSVGEFSVDLNVYTNHLIAPSDEEIAEGIIDQSNAAEVVQMDATWMQSKDAAQKTLKMIERGIEGFSKDVSLSIFGNPLIQVGDVVTLSYPLNGISSQKYVVHTVSHSFNQGLSTSLGLNRIQQ